MTFPLHENVPVGNGEVMHDFTEAHILWWGFIRLAPEGVTNT